MEHILHIDSTTKVCSVAISSGASLVHLTETDSDKLVHSEKLHVFIETCLSAAKIEISDLKAVAVSKGPGSYTGLRIGVSAAKGLCFGLNIPLIAVDTLAAMANSISASVNTNATLIPMIDARRLEVFCSVHQNNKTLEPVHARILDEQPFAELSSTEVYYFGDGAEKAQAILPKTFTYLPNPKTSAQNLIPLAWEKYKNNQFEDVAYFEPAYLKDFVAGKPKKML